MKKRVMNLGILGPGKISSIIANSIENISEINKYAVASRSYERAYQFKEEFAFEKAYGSYEEMLMDDNVDLVYIATPHAFHYQHMIMCIEHKKNILCEKAFCITEEEAIDVINKARENKVFLCEALITAFLPSRNIIKNLLESKVIGEVIKSYGVFGLYLLEVDRLVDKKLGGGALLDIGIYPLYFSLSTFGYDCIIENVEMKMYNDVDESEIVTLSYPNGMKCIVEASIRDNIGMYFDIYGTKGRIHIENISRPEYIDIYDENDKLISHIDNLRNSSGYEYEFLACKQAIDNNKIETDEMTHENTIALMKFMDDIRNFQ